MFDTAIDARRRMRALARPQMRARAAGGFALLEVVVAFIIAAMALGVLYHTELSSLHAIQTAARYQEALARARSRLAVAIHGAPLRAGDQEGDDGGGFHWRVSVRPLANTAVRPFGMRDRDRPTWVALALYDVSVRVWWTDRHGGPGPAREVQLDTQQLQSALQ